jgi:hypothetical protein
MHHNKYRTLTLDAAGPYTFLQLKIIDYLEKRSGQSITKLFDYISGISMGGVAAALLTIDKEGKPKYNAEKALIKLNYITSKMERTGFSFENIFHEQKLSDTIIPISLISMKLGTNSSPYESKLEIFSTYNAKKNEAEDFTLIEALAASTRYASLFPAYNLSKNKNEDSLHFDGGHVTVQSLQHTLIDLFQNKKINKIDDLYSIALVARPFPSKTDASIYTDSEALHDFMGFEDMSYHSSDSARNSFYNLMQYIHPNLKKIDLQYNDPGYIDFEKLYSSNYSKAEIYSQHCNIINDTNNYIKNNINYLDEIIYDLSGVKPIAEEMETIQNYITNSSIDILCRKHYSNLNHSDYYIADEL